MTRLFIAGHSDSGDTYLLPGELTWAERTRAWVERSTGEPCELLGAGFAPMGDGAADYLLRKVEAAAPDIVILPLGTYVFTVATVAESVKQRFGLKAERFYFDNEARFQARTSSGALRRRLNRLARGAARRVLGTRTMSSVATTTAIYAEVLQRLAQVESLQVVAVDDARFSEETQRREPKLHRRIDAMYARLMPIIERHRFIVADLEGALRRAPDRRVFYQDDGVHTTAAFHDVYFRVLQEALSPTLVAITRA